MLSVTHLSVRYGGVQALTDVSLKVDEGQIVTLLGINGAGKSTTLKAIAGLVLSSSGEIIFRGEPIGGLPAYKMAQKGISYIPEGRGIFPEMTTLENLLMGAYSRKDRKQVAQDLDQYFTLFPILKERRRQEAKTLSGGEQQMLAIARGLLTRPKLMLFDEPSLGLAPLIIKEVFEIIQNLQKMGSTILLVEQNATMALKAAHYAYLLEKGRISLEGAPDTFLANQHVIDAYLGRIAK